jgi:hypothetical protein
MANRNWASAGRLYSMHLKPILLDCNFVVDSTNGNGLGIRSLKGPGIQNVFMHTTVSPGQGNSSQSTPNIPVFNPNPTGSGPSGPPPGSPNLASSASFVTLGASAISNTGSSVLTGNLGLSPGTSVTGFPPGTVIGTQHITDAAASQAQTDATAAYTDLSTRASTVIPSALDGQVLSAGVYSFSSGSASLAASGNGTVTFNGSATDIFVIQTASTLTTGAGGTPTIAFTGGALASNLYWAVGSSATLNVSGTGAFEGTLIAQTSVTIDGGTGVARLMALTGAVTFSAATILSLPPSPPSSGGGVIVVQFEDNYARSLSGWKAIASPVSGTPLQVDNSALTPGVAYIITTVGNSTAAQWIALGLPKGVPAAVGASFVALNNGGSAAISSSRVMATASAGSGILTIETIGDPNQSLAPSPIAGQGFGAQILLQARSYLGADSAPADGTVISLAFLLNDSSVQLAGE